MKRKRCILGLLLIGMICLMGCGEEPATQMKQIDQKILFIYRYYRFGENTLHRGYFIDNQGRKVEFDLSEQGFEYAELDKVYEYLLNIDISRDVFLTVLSPAELQECYDCLFKIDMDNALEVKIPEENELGFYCWYGVMESEEDSPQFVVLLEEGSQTKGWKRQNSDEYAKKVLKRLLSD